MASPSLMDTLFQRSLDDIIKGLRNQQTVESAFISKVVEEIRREIKSTDLHTKSIALQKLSYLNSIYFIDMSWAAFHAIECISSPKFSHKKIGYLAISQSFHESTPVILLITNQLRKDLKSNNEFEVSLALQCLSTIGTVDLCRDLTSEVFSLMSTSKVFVRKKAIGLVLRVFAKYPDSVRVCFKRLVDCLDGTDPQIVSSVVGVFCELASKDAKSYLPLAPEFYKILVDSRNNWVLIKVLKIFSKLASLEPRLAKRVVEPICDHMRRTGAKSLVFECIRTVVTSFSNYDPAVKLAVSKVHEFLLDDDPNLKYLGLHTLSILAPTHLWAILENKEVVINSLSDADPNIKLESLRLVIAMVSENNVVEICKVLVNYALKSDPDFYNEIIGSILSKCSENVYEIIVDFDWYVSLLGDMSRIPRCQRSEEIENQLVDIGMRVKDVRLQLVRVCRELLIDPASLGNPFLHRILSAAAWVCGEYVEFSKNPIELVQALLQPRASLLPQSIRTVYLQSAFKVLIFCLHSYLLQTEILVDDVGLGLTALESEFDLLGSSDSAMVNVSPSYNQDEGINRRDSNKSYEDISLAYGRTDHTSPSLEKKSFMHESIINLINLIEMALGPLLGSSDVEVHERARNILGFIELIRPEIPNGSFFEEVNLMKDVKAYKIVELMLDAFSEELGPVSVKAQEKVAVPDGLVLKENLVDLDAICGNVLLPLTSSFSLVSSQGESVGASVNISQSKEESETSGESTSLLAEHRKRHGLYYLPSVKNELSENEYPPANDPKSGISTNNDALDLVKLTDQSLAPKKKASQAKHRPVVVKLDEGETTTITAKKPDIKDDSLSDAVRDILLGNAAVPTSQSQNNSSVKSSVKRKGKEKEKADLPEFKGNLDGEKPDLGNASSRRSKHRIHGREKGRKSPVKNDVEREDHGEKEKQKSRHRHGRHKIGQRSDGPINLVAQTTVIPDFLL